ncbi:MAG: hypothetical protein HY865_00490 [Chloroflexi bacterium]|nr:hypothetical protein [Chloroflexota bacterium]
MNKKRDIKYHLTLITATTTLLLSLFSLAFQDIYTARINRITEYELMGQDVVTAAISAVFLCVILFKDYQRIKTKIIWLGCLLYLFYIYAYFSFGGVSSVFYLLYVAITGLTLFLFLFILVDIIKNDQLPNVAENYPRKAISVFFFISILLITVIEIQELVLKTIILNEQLNPFLVFYVLDLAIIFPSIMITSVLNLRRTGWGYLFSGVALIKIATILPAVVFNDIFHRLYTGSFLDLSFDIIASIITLIASILLIMYMNRVDDKSIATHPQNER